MTARSNSYSDLVKTANDAVQGITDPELKKVAFSKVLDDLLSSTADSGRKRTGSTVPRSRPAKRNGNAAKKKAAGGPTAYITEMFDEGFFKKPKTITEVKTELQNRGHHIPVTSLSGPLKKLCQAKVLRRSKPPAADEGAQQYSYSNW